MRKFTTLAVTALMALGISGLAVSPALASSSGHGGHSPPMNISFKGSGDDTSGLEGSAHWIHRRTAVQLAVTLVSSDDSSGGSPAADATTATGSAPLFAEIVIHHVPADAPAAGKDPVLTVSGDGSPYLEMDFSGGGFLRGVMETDGTMTWTPYDSTGTLGPGTDYSAALAAEGANPTVERVFVYDAPASADGTFTDTVTAVQYNGVNLVPASNRRHGHSGHGGPGHGHSGAHHA
jgi:hypothetical protein